MPTHGCFNCTICGAWCAICSGCKHEQQTIYVGLTRPSPELLAQALQAGRSFGIDYWGQPIVQRHVNDPSLDVLFLGFVEGYVDEG